MRIFLAVTFAAGLWAQAPQLTKDKKFVKPADYREWVFLSSGLAMTYGGGTPDAAHPLFDNVFVNPSSYREFLKTGKWADGTTFILEVRASEQDKSINKNGHSQGAINHMSAEVKDSRLPGGWAFFPLRADSSEPSSALPDSAGCKACHSQHGAVEQTFVQFYPTLLPVAKSKGTLKSSN